MRRDVSVASQRALRDKPQADRDDELRDRVRVGASSAFVDGIHSGLLYASGAALLAAVIVTVLLSGGRRRGRRTGGAPAAVSSAELAGQR